jgi:hypothetical protein
MQLSIVTLGHVHAEDLAPLTHHFDRLEQLVLDIHPRSVIEEHRAELNRAVAAATADWILIIRERETVDDALAQEIGSLVTSSTFRHRIRTTPLYAGKPLRLGDAAGELRLFRRGSADETAGLAEHSFHAITFATPDEHREYLAKNTAPHSRLRHVLLFLSYAFAARTRDANTLRYLWIEAAFDHALQR